MLYEVYIDVFFLVNALLNLPVLILVKKIQHYKSSKLRLVLAAMAGSAILSLLVCVPVRRYVFVRMAGYIISYGAMTWIAFSCNRGKERIRAIIAMYICAIVWNGMIHWLSIRIDHVPMLVAVCLFGYLIMRGCFGIYEKMHGKEQQIYEVHIRYHGEDICLQGLWDTGNRLRSPYHARGVSVVSYDSLQEYLTDDIKACVEDREKGLVSGIKEPFFYIPYETVNQKHSVMPVIQAEKMCIMKPQGPLEYSNPLLGISRLPVSSNQMFQIILTTGDV